MPSIEDLERKLRDLSVEMGQVCRALRQAMAAREASLCQAEQKIRAAVESLPPDSTKGIDNALDHLAKLAVGKET